MPSYHAKLTLVEGHLKTIEIIETIRVKTADMPSSSRQTYAC
jgi:hypothetical protein